MQTCGRSLVECHVLRGLAREMTYIGDNAADNDLVPTGGLHGSTEVGVVHSVDLTVPMDDGDVGVHLGNLRDDWAVGALIAQRDEWLEGRPTSEMIGKRSPLSELVVMMTGRPWVLPKVAWRMMLLYMSCGL